jgi:hypothetical protein
MAIQNKSFTPTGHHVVGARDGGGGRGGEGEGPNALGLKHGSSEEGPEHYEARDQKDKMKLCMYLNNINLVLTLLLGILSFLHKLHTLVF